MKIARGIFIRLDDEHDRAAAKEAGLRIVREKLGEWPRERSTDVVVTADRDQARALIGRLNRLACITRNKAKRSGQIAKKVQISLEHVDAQLAAAGKALDAVDINQITADSDRRTEELLEHNRKLRQRSDS
jgi:hypothetical protein